MEFKVKVKKVNGSDIKNGQYVVPLGTVDISTYAFDKCRKLRKLSMPDTVIKIGACAFRDCVNLQEIILGKKVERIGARAFAGCEKLENITLPENISRIFHNTFTGCVSLTSLNIPYGVTAIEEHAFYNCKSLTSVTLPETIKVIEQSAFDGCIALEHIFYTGTRQRWNDLVAMNKLNGMLAQKVYFGTKETFKIEQEKKELKEGQKNIQPIQTTASNVPINLTGNIGINAYTDPTTGQIYLCIPVTTEMHSANIPTIGIPIVNNVSDGNRAA